MELFGDGPGASANSWNIVMPRRRLPLTSTRFSIRPALRTRSQKTRDERFPENILMTFSDILFEKKNAIAYVTVNRPKVLNALNMATMEELRTAFHAIKNDATVRVVIVTGEG